jgi:hypothetical protein
MSRLGVIKNLLFTYDLELKSQRNPVSFFAIEIQVGNYTDTAGKFLLND